MPLKQSDSLSRADFDEAVVRLRLNVSEIAKETGIPRTYLSEFRNGDRKLRPENLAKLRDFFESRGVEFDDSPDEAQPSALQPSSHSSPHPKLKSVQSIRCVFPIADSVPDEVIQRAMDMMDEDEVQLAVLLKQIAQRDDGFFGSGGWNEDTMQAMQEAGSLLAEIAIVFLALRGFRALGVKPAGESADTLRDALIATYRPRLEAAGLIEPDAQGESKAEETGEPVVTSKAPAMPWIRKEEAA